MTAPPSPTSSDHTTRKIDLNLTHVAATALAAVTAAVLGSSLGAAGTLIGAAGASVITTVGTALYKASLERSRERVRSLTRRRSPSPVPWEEPTAARPAVAPGPVRDEHPTGSAGLQPRDHPSRFARLRWGAMVAAATGGFLLAMMVITGFEWANGATVGGNGDGTTIGQVVTDQPPPREPATPPASPSPAPPVSETPTETTVPSDTSTSTTTPDDDADGERSPASTSDTPASSEVTTVPPLIPGLPGVEG